MFKQKQGIKPFPGDPALANEREALARAQEDYQHKVAEVQTCEATIEALASATTIGDLIKLNNYRDVLPQLRRLKERARVLVQREIPQRINKRARWLGEARGRRYLEQLRRQWYADQGVEPPEDDE